MGFTRDCVDFKLSPRLRDVAPGALRSSAFPSPATACFNAPPGQTLTRNGPLRDPGGGGGLEGSVHSEGFDLYCPAG